MSDKVCRWLDWDAEEGCVMVRGGGLGHYCGKDGGSASCEGCRWYEERAEEGGLEGQLSFPWWE